MALYQVDEVLSAVYDPVAGALRTSNGTVASATTGTVGVTSSNANVWTVAAPANSVYMLYLTMRCKANTGTVTLGIASYTDFAGGSEGTTISSSGLGFANTAQPIQVGAAQNLVCSLVISASATVTYSAQLVRLA